MKENTYPPIRDYGLIADCHSSALVSTSGSIDWCCMSRIDFGSCFGRILDWEKGGYCQIVPSGPYEVSRRYIEDTLVLETIFRTKDGEARLIDCFTMREGGRHNPHQQILRIIEAFKGRVEFNVEIIPCFDYGATKAWVRRYLENQHIALGGNDGLLISGDLSLEMKDRHCIFGSWIGEKGHSAHLSILYRRPEDLDDGHVEAPTIEELDRRLDETISWWRNWSSKSAIKGSYAGPACRSAVVLKALSYAPTGAIAAAATTSLPEGTEGGRNWDYRYTWIRDSSFSVRSLAEAGHAQEADGFRRFIERTTAGSVEDLRIVYGVGGECRLNEYTLYELEGYRGIKPVRIGNAAAEQRQLDVYGELLELAWSWHSRGHSPDDDYWDFLVALVNATVKNWKKPDRGFWEMRSKPRHFVLSKAMCWTALDRGLKLAEDLGREGPTEVWRKARDEVRRAIETKGYDAERGIFVQAFGRKEMDASLLLLPATGFLDYGDERMVRTVDAVQAELEVDGLLRRYPPGNDGISAKEGVFIPCSFWLAECFAQQGRRDEAHEVFRRALATGNDLGLFPEEYDTEQREMMGNFPQGLTHLSLIAAATALAETEKT